jgi:tetratricopeptide (TPR) repeat protein
MGVVKIFTNRAAEGIAELEQALVLATNFAAAHGHMCLGKIALGRAEETEAHIREALRLSPRDPFAYVWTGYVGLAGLFLGKYKDAIAWLRRSIELNRSYAIAHFYLALAGLASSRGA